MLVLSAVVAALADDTVIAWFVLPVFALGFLFVLIWGDP